MKISSHQLEEIKKLPPQEAIIALDAYLQDNPDNDEAFTLRGRNYWNLGKRREAINDYLSAIELNPESESKLLLDYSKRILDFYNKDLLNP